MILNEREGDAVIPTIQMYSKTSCFCRLLIFIQTFFSKKSFGNTISVSNNCDLDMARRFVEPQCSGSKTVCKGYKLTTEVAGCLHSFLECYSYDALLFIFNCLHGLVIFHDFCRLPIFSKIFFSKNYF